MAYLLGVPTLALLAALEASVLRRFPLLDGGPDLILLAVVSWALTGQRRQAMTLGLLGGILLNLLSGFPVGSSSIALILVAFLVSLTEGRFWEAHFLMPLAAVLMASVIYHSVPLGLLLILGRSPDWPYALSRVMLPSVFLNLVLALPVTQALTSLEETLYPPEVGI